MKVLLPVDASEPSMHTLQWVAKIFPQDTTRFYVLTVIDQLPSQASLDYAVEAANKTLSDAVEMLQKEGYSDIKTESRFGDVPATEICRYADEIDADQIVMGSHGRTGLSKVLMGSVSQGVMDKARKPVLLFNNRRILPDGANMP